MIGFNRKKRIIKIKEMKEMKKKASDLMGMVNKKRSKNEILYQYTWYLKDILDVEGKKNKALYKYIGDLMDILGNEGESKALYQHIGDLMRVFNEEERKNEALSKYINYLNTIYFKRIQMRKKNKI